MDIRSYFNAAPKKSSQTSNASSQNKKHLTNDDSIIQQTPTPKKNKVIKKKRKIESDSDSEDSFVPTKISKVKKDAHREVPKSKLLSKIKETKAVDVFGTAPIRRMNLKNILIKNKDESEEKYLRTESGIHLDDKFENALNQLDHESTTNNGNDHKDDIVSNGKCKNKIKSPNKNAASKTPTKCAVSKTPTKCAVSKTPTKNAASKTPTKDTVSKTPTKDAVSKTPTKGVAPQKSKDNSISKSNLNKDANHKNKIDKNENKSTKQSPKSKDNSTSPATNKFFENKKRLQDKSETKKDFSAFIDDVTTKDCKNIVADKNEKKILSPATPKTEEKSRKRKCAEVEKTPEMTDEERHEKKRYTAKLYQNYLNRSGPKNHGTKEVPEGSPNCLKGLAFLITGVLDSFEREEVVEIVKRFSGEVKSTLSGKVTHLICGDDAGPAKIAKAEKLGTTILNEDQFLELIKQKSLNGVEATSSNIDKTPKSIKKSKIDNKMKEKSKSPKKKNNSFDQNAANKKLQNVDSGIDVLDDVIIETNVEKIDTKKNAPADKNATWVDKYRPTTMKQIIGQHGDASCASKLHKWLSKWYVNRKAKLPKPSPWSKGDGGYYRAILLSGSPGVGKTTTVAVVSKELGFDTVEFNASDTRSKNLIQQQITEVTCNNSLSGFFNGKSGKGAVSKKHLIIMDEVDGMAGNEDRGGMQELINLIKKTEVPIVCICNDKSSPKMRSLLNYCYDITFPKPKVEQIKAALRSICFKEGIKISPDSLTELIIGASQDMRQILNLLSMWSSTDKNLSADTISQDSKMAKKDIKTGPWTTCRSVFSEEEHKSMSIHDKNDLFFNDYSLMPLFVQQNYLKVVPHCPKKEVLKRFAEAADCLSAGDLVDSKIRRGMAWNLLPTQAMFSTVIPGTVLSGHIQGQIDFPGWLGQNSRSNKMNRLAQEIQSHTRLSASGSKEAVRLDYAFHIRNAVLNPLTEGVDGIQKAVDTLQSYNLLRDDLDSLIELSKWPGQKDINASIDSKVKAAMTKKYNKEAALLPYSQVGVKKGNSANKDSGVDGLMDSENLEDLDEKEDSDVENDAMIKKNKITSSSKGKIDKKENPKQPSKGKGKGKKK